MGCGAIRRRSTRTRRFSIRTRSAVSGLGQREWRDAFADRSCPALVAEEAGAADMRVGLVRVRTFVRAPRAFLR
jgi:hypothetical protein